LDQAIHIAGVTADAGLTIPKNDKTKWKKTASLVFSPSDSFRKKKNKKEITAEQQEVIDEV
jgi:hypothetical protein